MELTPEERHRIYEEEKARIEARERLEKERRSPPGETTVDLSPGVAGMLCYLGWWITGLIFLIIEQKNEWVRYHAAQSLVLFGAVTVVGGLISLIPYIGPPLSGIIWFIGFILWIVLMLKTYQGERVRIPVAADLADRIVAGWHVTPPAAGSPEEKPAAPGPAEGPSPAAPPEEAPAPVPPAAPAAFAGDRVHDIRDHIRREVDDYLTRKQGAHVAGSAFAIAFSIVMLIFFNFFYDYVAYYTVDRSGAEIIWSRAPFFTDDISLWLPLLTTALVASIVGHLIIIVFYRPLLRQIVSFILDCFGLAVVLTLLAVFPFNFAVIPDASAASVTEVSVRVVLIVISVGIGISLMVRLITTLTAIGRAAAKR